MNNNNKNISSTKLHENNKFTTRNKIILTTTNYHVEVTKILPHSTLIYIE